MAKMQKAIKVRGKLTIAMLHEHLNRVALQASTARHMVMSDEMDDLRSNNDALQDQVAQLTGAVSSLTDSLDEETRKRKNLEDEVQLLKAQRKLSASRLRALTESTDMSSGCVAACSIVELVKVNIYGRGIAAYTRTNAQHA